MSQTGKIVLYTTRETPRGAIGALCRELGASVASTVTRSLEENRGWELFQKGEDPWPPEETVGHNLDCNGLEDLYVAGRMIRAECDHAEALTLAREGVMSLEQGTRGAFCPISLYISIGWHDLIEDNENVDGVLIARPFLSASFWGYGVPETSWAFARQKILGLECIKMIASRCSRVASPIESFALWSA